MSLKSQIQKNAIAEVAVDLFFEKRYKDCSLQDVAEKGNLSKAGIYHYFKSKSEILSYILLSFTQTGFESIDTYLKEAEQNHYTPQEILAKIINIYAKHLCSNPRINLLVLRERHQLDTNSAKTLLKQEQKLFRMVKNLVQEVNGINGLLNDTVMAFQIISMIHWMGYWYDSKGPLSEDEIIDQMTRIFFFGVCSSTKNKV